MLNEKEIRNALDINPTTARGRAEMNGRAIKLEPKQYEVEQCSMERARVYVDLSRALSSAVQDNRFGVTDSELENVEFVRELLLDIAGSIYKEMIPKG